MSPQAAQTKRGAPTGAERALRAEALEGHAAHGLAIGETVGGAHGSATGTGRMHCAGVHCDRSDREHGRVYGAGGRPAVDDNECRGNGDNGHKGAER